MLTQDRVDALLAAVREFSTALDSVFMTYFDGRGGFLRLREHLAPKFAKSAEMYGKTPGELGFIYGEGDPNTPEAKFLIYSTQQDVLDRNAEGGANHAFLANLCLVSVYQYWEDHYRKRVAKALGVEKNAVRLPTMGEIRHIRRSIIHNGARAVPAVEACAHFNFRAGDPIEVGREEMRELLLALRRDLRDLVTHALPAAGG